MRTGALPGLPAGSRREPASGGGQGGPSSGGAQHGLDLELDGDLVTDDDAAAVHRHVDVHAELLAGDVGLAGEAGAGAAVGVRTEPVELQVQHDGLGDALDGQVALDLPVLTVVAHRGRAEGHHRVVADVEEVRGLDVRVPLLLPGVDRVHVDGGVHGRGGRVGGGHDLAGELTEVAADLADHHVPDGEADGGVCGVDVPRADDVAGDLRGAGHGDLQVVERLTFAGGSVVECLSIPPVPW